MNGLSKSAWDDFGWRSLPQLGEDVEADVCVVGLGGSGLTCINRLLSRGKTVVGIDASTVGGGAAGRNGGFLLAGSAAFYHDTVASIGREAACELYRRTLEEMDRIEAETPSVITRQGSLRIAVSEAEEADCLLQLQAMRADDFPVETYEGPEGRGLLIPGDGAFHPLARCRLLADKAIDNGARLHEISRAVSISESSVTVATGGKVSCDKVIVAVDGNLERLLPELSGRVRTARLQMLATEPAPEVSIPRPVYARYGYDYWQQLPDGRVVVGGCRDREGEAEWTSDAAPSAEIQRRLERLLRERLRVTSSVTHRWAALVSYTDDEKPLLEEVRPGVLVIGAYSGTGNVMGALYGRMAADLT